MPTLHSNNPVPSNGSVATVIRGVKSISMTLSGVGAVRAVVQIMAHEDGAAPGPIGNQIVVSGTTTVTTTQTFNAEAGEVYLQLIDITPACKFSATLTELGPIQDTNPGSPTSPFASAAERTAWATANLSTLRSGVSTVWGPGAVEYVWNGPLATGWGPIGIRTSIVDVAFFGDSQSQIGYPDVSPYPVATVQTADQATNQTRYRWPNSNQTGYRIICDFGIPGETTTQMLARATGIKGVNRRALSDLAAAGVKAVYFVGMSINDFVDNGNDAHYDAVVARHAKIVKQITDYGIRVYDAGAIGYSLGSHPTYNARILYCNAKLQENVTLAQNPLWAFISTLGILHDSTGTYLPKVSFDGVHLSPAGTALLINAIESRADADFGKYVGNRTLAEINDWAKDVNSASGGYPANWEAWFGANSSTNLQSVTENTAGEMVFDFSCLATGASPTRLLRTTDYTIVAETPLVAEIDFELYEDGAPSANVSLDVWVASENGANVANSRQAVSCDPASPRRKLVTVPIIFTGQTTCKMVLSIGRQNGLPLVDLTGKRIGAKIYSYRLLDATNF